jgi:hypothetical protein
MSVVRITYPKLFAKMSGHFLIQELPDNWYSTLTDEEIEDWFVENTWQPFEWHEWDEVYDMVERLTDEVWEIYHGKETPK